ncbi:hypothetical protein [Pseudarthrobacter sp. C4D7]|uniref:hypothetical protein n=1 Tax=Pseudarthrobacter sp. C4D7 TaxID=2735268 RepID=UPI001585B794|nr:hypothetical protein [Pseudarthrobacter sp. C4D7]NUT71605.1 hypothetical protein [Pseudarthrobacter sp. C4D7]
MNSTNRAVNRLFLAIAGLVLLGAGLLAAGAGLVPGIADQWTAVAGGLLERWQALLSTAPAPEPLGSWWTLALPALLLLGAVASIFWLTRQGGGRTGTAAGEQDPELGDTAVDVSYLAAGVEQALKGNRAVVGSSLTAWRGRNKRNESSALRLTLQARKGASPREVADLAEDLVGAIDAQLGHHPTVLVRIGSGTRTKLASAHRAG